MRMEFAFPKEATKAKKERWPLIIPVGTMEYHGPHCSFGCDTLIVDGMLKKIEEKRDIVIYPPVWYGVSSYAVAGPEKDSITVDVDAFEENMYGILKSLLYGGWRNIYMVIHHQYEGEVGNPMTLACMKAGRKLVFEYLEETMGKGWWGKNENKTFYHSLEHGDNPWNWISVLPAMSKEAQNMTGYDHAGEFEASLLMALYKEAVDLSRLKDSDEWFIQSAAKANKELGEKMLELSIDALNERIK